MAQGRRYHASGGIASRGWRLLVVAGLVAGLGCAAHSRLVAQDDQVILNDLRALQEAEVVYEGLTSSYGTLDCLAEPWTCIAGFPGDRSLLPHPAIASLAPENGYARHFFPGPPAPVPHSIGPAGLMSSAYTAVPVKDRRGRKAYCVDATGRVCATLDGRPPKVENGTCASPCERIR